MVEEAEIFTVAIWITVIMAILTTTEVGATLVMLVVVVEVDMGQVPVLALVRCRVTRALASQSNQRQTTGQLLTNEIYHTKENLH